MTTETQSTWSGAMGGQIPDRTTLPADSDRGRSGQVSSPLIEIVAFKRNEYDRGTKKIVVDGEQWGWITMSSHGSAGPTYHAHDMHGPVMVPRGEGWGRRKGEPIEHQYAPQRRRHTRIQNIGKPEAEQTKIVPIETQLREQVAELIDAGHIQSPAKREREITESIERHRRAVEAAERKQAERFTSQAQAIIDLFETGRSPDEIRDAIVKAMKWAQTQ